MAAASPALRIGGAPPVDAAVHHLGPRTATGVQSAGSPSVTTSVCPSSRRLRRPGVFSPIHPMTFGRPGATGCTSTPKPSRRSHASTNAAIARPRWRQVTRAMDARDADRGSCQLDDLVGIDLGEERRQRGHWG